MRGPSFKISGFSGWATALSLSAACGGQYLLHTSGTPAAGLALMAAAAFLFVFSTRKQAGPGPKPGRKTEIMLFALMLLLAAAFRLYRINEVPSGCFVDEAQNIFDAQKIINGEMPVYVGFSTDNAALFLYPLSAVVKLFGAKAVCIRSLTAVFGVMSVAVMYFLLRASLGAGPALAGGFIMAMMRWHVVFSRIGYHASFALLVFLLLLYFAYRSVTISGLFDFIMLGLTAGLSQHTYQSARLVPFWLVVLALIMLARDRKLFYRSLAKLSACVLIALVTASPLLFYAATNPKTFFERQNDVNIFNKAALSGWKFYNTSQDAASPFATLGSNISATLLMFNYRGDTNPKNNLPAAPELDFMTGVLFFLGFFYALFRLKEPPAFFFLSLFAVFIIPGFITIEAPQSLRLFFLIPAVVFFTASCGWRLMEEVHSNPSNHRLAAALTMAVVFSAAAAENYGVYFTKQARDPSCWYNFSTDAYEAGRFLRQHGDKAAAIIGFERYKTRSFNLSAYEENTDRAQFFEMTESVPLRPAGGSGIIYLLSPFYTPLIEPLLKVAYPGGRLTRSYNRYDPGWVMFFAYEVSAEEAAKAGKAFGQNGLRLKRYDNGRFEGPPVFDGVSPAVFLDQRNGNFSYEWTGRLKTPKNGVYSFSLQTSGDCFLSIDGKKLLDVKGSRYEHIRGSAETRLAAGFHAIEVKYSQENRFTYLELNWLPPGAAQEGLVPFDALYQ